MKAIFLSREKYGYYYMLLECIVESSLNIIVVSLEILNLFHNFLSNDQLLVNVHNYIKIEKCCSEFH